MRRRFVLLVWGVVMVVVVTGCQFAQSGFVRVTGEAGGTLAAAATTLRYVHEGRLTQAYARSAFERYEKQLSEVEGTLPGEDGVPSGKVVEELLRVYKPALEVAKGPCLGDGCDWEGQVKKLERASKEFLRVGEGEA